MMIHPITRSHRSQRTNSGDTGLSFRSGVERLFEQFLEPLGGGGFGSMTSMQVPVEIYEANNETVVTAELPGMNPDDINITATGNQLVISGEKRDENEERRGNFFRTERRYGMFRRVLELPYEINPDEVKVEFDNGLLKLRIPQSAAQQPRRIPVKTGAGQNSGRQDQIGGSASSGSAAQQVGGRFRNRSDGAGSSAGSSQGRLGEASRPSQSGPSNQRT